MPSFSCLVVVLGPGTPGPAEGRGPSRCAGGGPAEPGRGVPGLGRLYRYSRAKTSPTACTVWSMSPWVWA